MRPENETGVRRGGRQNHHFSLYVQQHTAGFLVDSGREETWEELEVSLTFEHLKLREVVAAHLWFLKL